MPYTTMDRVRSLLPENILADETSEPSDDMVEGWQPGVEARVDIAIRVGGGTTPITEATALLYLDLLCAKELAWMIMYHKDAAKKDHEYHTEFEDALTTFMEEGLPVALGSAGPSSYTMDAPSTSDTSINPVITNDTVF